MFSLPLRDAVWLRVVLGLVCPGSVVAFPLAAEAEPARDAVGSQVEVSLSGSDEGVAMLGKALVDPLRRAGINVVLQRISAFDAEAVSRRQGDRGAAGARLWFDLAKDNEAMLYLTDAQAERVYVRAFTFPRGLDEIAVEQLVVAARSSVQAILSGARIGVQREEYERSLHAPSPPVPSTEGTSRSSVGGGARVVGLLASSYEVQAIGARTFGHGPGLALALQSGRFAGAANVHARLPVRVGDDDLGLRLTTVGARLVGSVHGDIGRSWEVFAGAGGGVDLTFVKPQRELSADATVGDAFWRADPLLHDVLGITLRLQGWMLSGSLGADLYLARVRYTIERGGGVDSLFVPWTLRPFVGIELKTVLWR